MKEDVKIKSRIISSERKKINQELKSSKSQGEYYMAVINVEECWRSVLLCLETCVYCFSTH